jgi:hypothetical protein
VSPISYFRTSVAEAGKFVPVLRPSRMPKWRLPRPSIDFYDSVSDPRTTAPAEPVPQPLISASTKDVESGVQSTETVNAFLQHASNEFEEVFSRADGPSRLPAETFAISKRSSAFRERGETTFPHPSTPRKERRTEHHAGGDVAKLTRHRRDPREPTQNGEVDHITLRPISSLANAVAQSLTAHADPGRNQSQDPRWERRRKVKQFRDSTHQDVSNFRDWMPVLRGVARGSVSSKQASIKPSGNAIHIGNVDIHIHSSPSPVRPLVRQLVRAPTPIMPIARGFAASFGLNQG